MLLNICQAYITSAMHQNAASAGTKTQGLKAGVPGLLPLITCHRNTPPETSTEPSTRNPTRAHRKLPSTCFSLRVVIRNNGAAGSAAISGAATSSRTRDWPTTVMGACRGMASSVKRRRWVLSGMMRLGPSPK